MTFRVLGSPYTLQLHQHVTYLRLKCLPFKVYCRTFTTTLFYAFLFRARNAFCTVSPDAKSHLQMWQLVDVVESSLTLAGPNAQKILVSKRTHPNIHLASWIVVVYASWWLAKTGAMFRWSEGDSTEVVEGYLRYFFLVSGVGVARTVAGSFRRAMQKLTAISGVSQDTAPYMREHFHRMCAALDRHFGSHEDMPFLLNTPHPTLADVSLGAVFSAYFLMDDPPASLVVERYTHLNRYLERVTGWRGGVFDEEETKDKSMGPASSSSLSGTGTNPIANVLPETGEAKEEGEGFGDYADVVPESLTEFFALVEEVFPFMLSQCAAFHAYMAGDGVRCLPRQTLEGQWNGCSAYLLQQMTDIKSLMIIDNGVYTVCARAQDLEIALRAAREVVDDNEKCEDAPVTKTLSESHSADTSKADESIATPAVRSDTVSNDVGINEEVKENEEDDSLDSLANDADFHRVFTAQRGRGRAATQLCQTSTRESLSRATVDTRLQALRGMLCKMHHPHYTLSSVFHGRRIYVAVIPEYEVARKRGERS